MKTTKFTTVVLLLILTIQTQFSFGQNSLSGKITDSKSNAALNGATIYIADIKIGSVSNADGAYQVNNIPNGTYLVEVKVLGYSTENKQVTIKGAQTLDFSLDPSPIEEKEVVVTGNSKAADLQHSPQAITEVTNQYINENSSTNVIDAIAKTPGVSAMTDGQSIAKPVIRGLGYNRVLTMNDGVEQVDQAWFDEFGIEADPDAVNRYEILKGPASLAYGSDAISGVINLIPEQPLPAGQIKGDVLFNYQNNNGLFNNMVHIAGTSVQGISWSARLDNIMAHAYQNQYDGYVLNSQFSDFNADGTIGIHRKWGYSQLHGSYFDMATGIVDGTRDSTGTQLKNVAYSIGFLPTSNGLQSTPGFNAGQGTYVYPTFQDFTSYTPFVINQRIRHSKVVWDNSLAVGSGRITGIFSYQLNQRQETNDPTMPNTPDIYYSSKAVTYDVRYVSPQMGGFNFSAGANGIYQASQSLGTLMLIPNYNLFQIGGFAIANEKIGRLYLTGGIRYDTRSFTGVDHWIDSTTQEPAAADAVNAFHEFQGFKTTFSGVSGSIGAAYDITKDVYVKANIGRGFRAPNVAECAANGVHDGTVVYEIGEPTLKPETSLEEDITFGINSKEINFEVNGFFNNITDFIYAQGLQSKLGGDSINNSLNAVGLGAAPVYKYTSGDVQLYGGEASLDIHPSVIPWIDLLAGFSMVSGGLQKVPDSIKVLPFVPPEKLTVDLKFPIKKIGKGIKNAYFKIGMQDYFQQNNIYLQTAIYTGLSTASTPAEYAASRAATAGYVLFDAGVGGDIQSKGHTLCHLYIICNNLFNSTYMDYMSRFKYYPVNDLTGRVGVFNMGRNVSVKLIIPFDIKG